MEGGGRAKDRIQTFIADLARREGIDPQRLDFKWDEQREIVASENGLALRKKFYLLTLSLEKKWRILTFAESAIRSAIWNPRGFSIAYRDSIFAVVSNLKQLSRRARFVEVPAAAGQEAPRA